MNERDDDGLNQEVLLNIQGRLEALSNLNSDLDSLEAFFDSNKELIEEGIKSDSIGVEQRCDLNWSMAYSVYTMYFRKYFINSVVKGQ